MANRLILVRHGLTEFNIAKRYIGATDAPLAPEGEEQARRLAPYIAAAGPDKILCSPMRRTTATAEIATEGMALEIGFDDDLREIAFGKWEGLTFEEIESIYGDQARLWTRWEDEYAFPEGESIGDFLSRVRRVARKMADNPADTLAVFTHGGVIRQLVCVYLGLPPDRFFSFRVTPGSITTIELAEGHGTLSGMWRPGDMEGT